MLIKQIPNCYSLTFSIVLALNKGPYYATEAGRMNATHTASEVVYGVELAFVIIVCLLGVLVNALLSEYFRVTH